MAWYSSRSRSYSGFAPYVPVAQRRAQAEKAAAKAAKNGSGWAGVTITGKKIATTFWGKAWCDHLESYSDYENRLPRGRTYVRNGSVVDLQITAGLITARVQGSSLYEESIKIKPLAPARWVAIKAACVGKITSLVGLLQGRLPDEVLRVITDRASGLFPAPNEIELDCSCPDSASLCKHLAAVLYGVGARLDSRPELLFLLRGVDHQELVAEALSAVSRSSVLASDSVTASLADADLADVFGIDIGGAAAPVIPAVLVVPTVPAVLARVTPLKPVKTTAPALPVVKVGANGRQVAKSAPVVKPAQKVAKPEPKGTNPTKSAAKVGVNSANRVPKVTVKPVRISPRKESAVVKSAAAVAKAVAQIDALLTGKPKAKSNPTAVK